MNRFKDDILEGFEHLDDQVNHPSHYRAGQIECIDYIEDFLTDLNTSDTSGVRRKIPSPLAIQNGQQDLEKAAWYLDRLIKAVEANNDND